MDWTRELTQELIKLYKYRPSLYTVSSPDYQNKNKREALFREIAVVLSHLVKREVAVRDIKKKINNLRSAFIVEKGKIKKSELSDNVYKPRVWWFKELDFLNDTAGLRPSTPNVSTVDAEIIMDQSILSLHEELDEDTFLLVPKSEPIEVEETPSPISLLPPVQQVYPPRPTTPIPGPGPSLKRKKNTDDELLQQSLEVVSGVNSSRSSFQTGVNDCVAFGMLMADHLQAISSREKRIEVQKKCLDIIQSALKDK